MMKKVLLAVTTLSGMFGCAIQPQMPQPAPVVTISCKYPVITPLPETKESQTKGGINISLAPNSFQCSKSTQQTTEVIQPSMGDTLAQNLATNGNANLFKLVETTSNPVYEVTPDKFGFRIKIHNQMPRVFRGTGTVVLYNFGGKNTSISSQEYAELTNLMIPPRTEAEVTIYGPSFKTIPEKTTLGIFLYDVVTKTDNAGNITEKQNFEWYYQLKTETKEDTGEVKKTAAWVRR